LNSDRFLYPAFEDSGERHVMDVFREFKSVLPLMPTYHHWNHRAAFDHILLRGADAVETYVPDSGGVCPNAQQGSDHLPVKAKIVLHP
jgi:endonuclease/exonuclease/phosphatase family metal-dependent hydrolase